MPSLRTFPLKVNQCFEQSLYGPQVLGVTVYMCRGCGHDTKGSIMVNNFIIRVGMNCLYLPVYLDDVTNKVQPLCSSAKVTLASDRMSPAYTDTQDSLINDSGFLPSTPPRKKVCTSTPNVNRDGRTFIILLLYM